MNVISRWSWYCFAAMFAVLFGVLSLSAQNITGEIDGRVTDASGAVVPNATVVVTNSSTNRTERTVKTNAAGGFSATILPVGTYSVAVSARGFKTTSMNALDVNVGSTLSIDPKLQTGEVTSVVTVHAISDAPNVETTENSSLISGTEMKEVALNTRNFEQLLIFQPGVSFGGDDELYPGMVSASGSTNAAQLSINGLRPTQMTWLVDGSDILNHGGSAQISIFPSVDAIQQIKIVRNNYGAQYGGGGSAQVLVATKSGGSDFHGDAYYFFRSQYLNANDFFNLLATPIQQRPPIRYNNFGYTVGGPVFIPKIYPRAASRTYFFFSQEFRRIALYPSEQPSNYPQMPQAHGYFQHAVCIAYAANGTTCTTFSPQVGSTPYPGFNYQVQNINTVSQAYLNDLILPALNIQLPNSSTDAQGLIYQQKSTDSETQELVRLDHRVNERLSLFFRYIFDPLHLQVPYGLYRMVGYPGVGNASIYSYGENFMGHATYTVSANTVMDIGYSYEPYQIKATPTGNLLQSQSPDVQVTLPYPTTLARIPSLTINGGAWTTTGNYRDLNHTQQLFENTTSQIGKHTLYYGINFEHYYETANQGTNNAGTFAFTGAKNATTGATAFEMSFANFLTGYVNSFTQASVDSTATPAENLFEVYAQDNWRILPHFTLDLGLRYSYYGQVYDRNNHLGVFQADAYNPGHTPAIGTTGLICTATTVAGCATATPNPQYDALNGVIQGGASGFGKSVSQQPMLDFAPRVGFAWDIFGNGRTSLRGGYGIFYNQTPLSIEQGQVGANPAYVQNPSYGHVPFGDPASGAATANVPGGIEGQSPSYRTPYTQSWGLDVQTLLPHQILIDVGYDGNNTIHLLGDSDLNEPLSGQYHTAGINGGTYITAGNPTQALNQIRPYTGYSSINYYMTNFFADYNALQTSLTKRFGSRSLVNINYTWSKGLTNNPGTGTAAQNTYNLAAEYGPTNLDRRNIFNANFVYELPFYRQQKGVLGEVLGGWELSGVVQMVSGKWFTVAGTAVDPAGQGALATSSDSSVRPDMISNPNRGGSHTVGQFFNTAAFALVPTGLYRPGNEKRNSVLGPGYQNWNLDLFRNINLPKSLRLQVRLESFNTFNHVNYDTMNVQFNAAAFGQITGARDMRNLQLGAKLYF